MKAIMVMYDSLNRHMLEPYGCDWTHTPNFKRLAERSVTFDNCYVGSMPCMPARRELHTGRYNFLHRSWGPIEPFDDSMPEMLKNHGVYSHLITDHYHYWEEGGATYHTRYSSCELVRGQEGDYWKAHLPDNIDLHPDGWNWRFRKSSEKDPRHGTLRHDYVNRHYMDKKGLGFCQARTFDLAAEFLDVNHGEDQWFLQVETFDPHEPYHVDETFRKLYGLDDSVDFDWPPYGPVGEHRDLVDPLRKENAALVSMCDHHLGRVLDLMDRYDLWKDTLLIVNTDHGFLLGEHDLWAKCAMPFYGEIAHTPLFVWDPRVGAAGERRKALVQTIDLPATILDFFELPLPPDMQGRPLRQTMLDDSPVREAGLFGIHGGHVNVTDGRYVYMRAYAGESNAPLFQYTLMPTHMKHTFAVEEFAEVELAGPFSFTKGCRVMKTPSGYRRGNVPQRRWGTLLFDLETDPRQERPLRDDALERRMTDLLVRCMKANDAPQEQYERLGLVDSTAPAAD